MPDVMLCDRAGQPVIEVSDDGSTLTIRATRGIEIEGTLRARLDGSPTSVRLAVSTGGGATWTTTRDGS